MLQIEEGRQDVCAIEIIIIIIIILSLIILKNPYFGRNDNL